MFDFGTRSGPERICVCILFHFVESTFRFDVAPASNSSEVMLYFSCICACVLVCGQFNFQYHRYLWPRPPKIMSLHEQILRSMKLE